MRKIYEKTIENNVYDYAAAQKNLMEVLDQKVKAKEMPSIMAEFVETKHRGCCLHYAMTLYKFMHEAGYEVYLVTTPETDGQTHASVCYEEAGRRFIADPVETIKTGDWRYAKIPFEEFVEKNEWVKLYEPYGIYGDELFFEKFLGYPKESF